MNKRQRYSYRMLIMRLNFTLIFIFLLSCFSAKTMDCSLNLEWSDNWIINLKTSKYGNSKVFSTDLKKLRSQEVREIILSGLKNIQEINPCLLKEKFILAKTVKLKILNSDKPKKYGFGGTHRDKRFLRSNVIRVPICNYQNRLCTKKLSSMNLKNTLIHEFLHFLNFDNNEASIHNKGLKRVVTHIRGKSYDDFDKDEQKLPSYSLYTELAAQEADDVVYACANFSTTFDLLSSKPAKMLNGGIVHIGFDYYRNSEQFFENNIDNLDNLDKKDVVIESFRKACTACAHAVVSEDKYTLVSHKSTNAEKCDAIIESIWK